MAQDQDTADATRETYEVWRLSGSVWLHYTTKDTRPQATEAAQRVREMLGEKALVVYAVRTILHD